MQIPQTGSVVAQFGASWCQPCHQIQPHVEAMAHTMAAEFVYIDMEKHVSLTNGYNIRSLPTIIAFRDGREVGRVAGANKKQIQSMLESTL